MLMVGATLHLSPVYSIHQPPPGWDLFGPVVPPSLHPHPLHQCDWRLQQRCTKSKTHPRWEEHAPPHWALKEKGEVELTSGLDVMDVSIKDTETRSVTDISITEIFYCAPLSRYWRQRGRERPSGERGEMDSVDRSFFYNVCLSAASSSAGQPFINNNSNNNNNNNNSEYWSPPLGAWREE